MATTTVLQFMQRTADDTTLRQQLESLLGVGDGNISSEAELDPEETAALKGDRAPIVAEFAAQHGFPFSADELIRVVDAFQKHQAGEMSDTEFAALIGISSNGNMATEMSGASKVKKWFLRTYLGM